MQISVKIQNIDSELNKISSVLKENAKAHMLQESAKILHELKEETPVDTGNARDSWQMKLVNSNEVSISNDVPYIDRLNHGSSKQAPAHFIEKVALRHGKPVGAIVIVSE